MSTGNMSDRLNPLRHLALKWYRDCLRSARVWPGNVEEKEYIRNETLRGFREARGITDVVETQMKVRGDL